MAYYNDKEEREEFQRRMKRISQQINEQRSSCAKLTPTMGTCGSVCANIQSLSYQPSASFLQPDEMSVGEKMFKQLAEENKKLTGEKSKLILQVNKLQQEVRILREDKDKYKAFAEANKNKIFKDFFLSIKEGTKLLYQDVIKWFNT
jgi:hypothetical protein